MISTTVAGGSGRVRGIYPGMTSTPTAAAPVPSGWTDDPVSIGSGTYGCGCKGGGGAAVAMVAPVQMPAELTPEAPAARAIGITIGTGDWLLILALIVGVVLILANGGK